MIKLIFRLVIYYGIWRLFEHVLHLNYKAEVWAALFIGFEAAFIGLTQLRNTRDTLEVELFMKFNERYSKLNDILKKTIENKELDYSKDSETLKAFEDYINLCCEEYYCYHVKKQIPFSIWEFWHKGIMYNLKHCKGLKEFFDSEFEANGESFYFNKIDNPFKEKIKENIFSTIVFQINRWANIFY